MRAPTVSSPCPIAQCTLTFLPLHDMEAARDVLLGVLARGGAAAALVPGLVKDSLQASPNVFTDDAATIQRVSA